MATGTVTLDFGAFPGKSDAGVDVAGQAGFTAASLVEAWLIPVDTPDHLADEHMVETLRVFAKYKVDGTFTVHGFNTSQLNEPLVAGGEGRAPNTVQGSQQKDFGNRIGGRGTRIWGRWSVAWAWS